MGALDVFYPDGITWKLQHLTRNLPEGYSLLGCTVHSVESSGQLYPLSRLSARLAASEAPSITSVSFAAILAANVVGR